MDCIVNQMQCKNNLLKNVLEGDSMNKLTETEMLHINGGKLGWKDMIGLVEPACDTLQGIYEGFRDTVKELPR